MIKNKELIVTSLPHLKLPAGLSTGSGLARFYPLLVPLTLVEHARTEEALIEAGNKLVTLAEHAYGLRQTDVVRQASQWLMSLPLPRRFGSIGRHYRGLCHFRSGRFSEAITLFENVVEELPLTYKARTMMSIGASLFLKGDWGSALPFYLESARIASHKSVMDWRTTVEAHRSIAVLKSVNGDHCGSLADLESLSPIVRAVGLSDPSVYYHHFNSLAVELCEVNRLEEARRASEIALASPYAATYPEWHETRNDIARKQYRTPRSFIALTGRGVQTENIFRLPVQELITPSTSSSARRAKILNYTQWKKKMVNDMNGNDKDDQAAGEVSDRQMLLRIVELASTDDLSDDALREMVEALEKIVKAYKEKK